MEIAPGASSVTLIACCAFLSLFLVPEQVFRIDNLPENVSLAPEKEFVVSNEIFVEEVFLSPPIILDPILPENHAKLPLKYEKESNLVRYSRMFLQLQGSPSGIFIAFQIFLVIAVLAIVKKSRSDVLVANNQPLRLQIADLRRELDRKKYSALQKRNFLIDKIQNYGPRVTKRIEGPMRDLNETVAKLGVELLDLRKLVEDKEEEANRKKEDLRMMEDDLMRKEAEIRKLKKEIRRNSRRAKREERKRRELQQQVSLSKRRTYPPPSSSSIQKDQQEESNQTGSHHEEEKEPSHMWWKLTEAESPRTRSLKTKAKRTLDTSLFLPPTITIPKEGQLTTINGQRKALLVGKDYEPKVSGSMRDVQNMRNFLWKYGFHTANIMTEDQQDTNMRPTKENVLQGFVWLLEGAQEGDSLFFHYCAHGLPRKNIDGDESDCYDEVIVYEDKVIDEELFSQLVKSVPAYCRLTIVLDTCYLGTGVELPYFFKRNDWKYSEKDEPIGDIVLFSVNEDRQNAETSHDGAITSSFVKALNSNIGCTYFNIISDMENNLQRSNRIPLLSCSKAIDVNQQFLI